MRENATRPTYLFVLPWSLVHTGGVNQVVINLAREMVRSGTFEPLVLIADWDSRIPTFEKIHGVQTVRWRIRPYCSSKSLLERVKYLLWERRFRVAFLRFCRDNRVAAINIHYPDAIAFALDRAANSCSAPMPLVISFHGADLNQLSRASSTEIGQWRELLSRAQGLVACSRDLADRVQALFGDNVSPLVVHNGLDAPAFVAMAKGIEPNDGRMILNVATFEEKKGQDILLQAFATIAREYEDVSLCLVGATGAKLDGLKEFCISNGIDARVNFFPDVPHEHIADFFRRATVFCLPSRQEPFGIVLLEAGAFGLPVVASRVGGIPEILTDGLTGLLVSPDDPAELAIALRRLLDSPTASKEMGTRLSQHVLSHFSWRVALEKYGDVLNGGTRQADVSEQLVRPEQR